MNQDIKERWYDKDQNLKQVVNLLRQTPEEVQNDIAMDMIQFILNENFTNSDDLIRFAKTNFIGKGERWYDKDDLIHTAVEMLKLLNDQERKLVISELADSIVYFTSKYRAENEGPDTRNRYLSDKST